MTTIWIILLIMAIVLIMDTVFSFVSLLKKKKNKKSILNNRMRILSNRRDIVKLFKFVGCESDKTENRKELNKMLND